VSSCVRREPAVLQAIRGGNRLRGCVGPPPTEPKARGGAPDHGARQSAEHQRNTGTLKVRNLHSIAPTGARLKCLQIDSFRALNGFHGKEGSSVRVRQRALEERLLPGTFRRSAVGLVVVSFGRRVPSGYHSIADGLPRLADDIDGEPPPGGGEFLKDGRRCPGRCWACGRAPARPRARSAPRRSEGSRRCRAGRGGSCRPEGRPRSPRAGDEIADARVRKLAPFQALNGFGTTRRARGESRLSAAGAARPVLHWLGWLPAGGSCYGVLTCRRTRFLRTGSTAPVAFEASPSQFALCPTTCAAGPVASPARLARSSE
jgi:hypothetical protein